ncbi:MAG: sarcosine oxidase [Maricaulis sp.]|jgi:sarcosine oxidase
MSAASQSQAPIQQAGDCLYAGIREENAMLRSEVGIIGLGAMGIAAALSLARQGISVRGFDRFGPGHEMGSSHGATRIIRSVYFEGAIYNPLIGAAYAAWARLEAEAGVSFFHRTGGLDISLRRHGVFEAALAAAMNSGQAFEVIEGVALESRFPALDMKGCGRAVYAPDSGVLDSDSANAWMRSEAERLGAALQFDCRVRGWSRDSQGFTLETASGPVQVERLIVAAGAWMGELFPQLAPVLIPERQVIGWFDAPGLDGLPIFQLESPQGGRYYGMPPHGGRGLKLGLYHHRGEQGVEHIAARGIDAVDRGLLEAGLDLALPGVARHAQAYAECRFTLAPDERFLIGNLPQDDRIVVLSPCSGHGYKFAPLIGEIAADLAMGRKPAIDIAAFSPSLIL